MKIESENKSTSSQLRLRSAIFDPKYRTVKVVNFARTRQATDSYHKTSSHGDIFRDRCFKTFNMHAQPPHLPYSSPRYNCLLMKGARSEHGPWTTTAVQLLGCEWRCWYCYVDPINLAKSSPHAVELSFAEILNMISQIQPNILDISGGQPDLIPEWLHACHTRVTSPQFTGKVNIRSEDNLNNDFLWRFLDKRDVERLAASATYTRIGCFKGFDDASVRNVVGKFGSCARQLQIAEGLIKSGFEPYYYATFSPESSENLHSRLEQFLNSLRAIEDWLPLRVVPLRLREPSYVGVGRSFSERRLQLNTIANDIWFNLISEKFGEAAFTSELEQTV